MVVAVSGVYEEKQMAFYKFFASKRQEFVIDLLGGSFSHALMTDGLYAYSNYYAPCTKLNCMAHARRKFHEAVKVRDDYRKYRKEVAESGDDSPESKMERLEAYPELKLLMTALALFAKLYHIESLIADLPYGFEQKSDRVSPRSVLISLWLLSRRSKMDFPNKARLGKPVSISSIGSVLFELTCKTETIRLITTWLKEASSHS